MNAALTRILATCIVGRMPFAPGTWGSLLGLGLGYLIVDRFGWFECFLAFVFITFLGAYVSGLYMRQQGGEHDPGEIVIDEVAGQWLTLLTPILLLHLGTWLQTGTLNVIALEHDWVGIYFALAFVLFRAFDILKPWPISFIDRKLKGGFGVMLDDLFAAVAAGVILYVIYIVGPIAFGDAVQHSY